MTVRSWSVMSLLELFGCLLYGVTLFADQAVSKSLTAFAIHTFNLTSPIGCAVEYLLRKACNQFKIETP